MTEYLTVKELAALLRLKERKVYDLAAQGQVPCSRATGKLLFPREEVERWLAARQTGPAAARPVALPGVVLGSHDPLLEWALRESRCGLATYLDGSLDGLERFARHEGVATGLHILCDATGEWNAPLVAESFAAEPVVLVAFCRRRRGLILREGLRDTVGGMSDLRGLRVAPRQPEAGAQRLFLSLLAQAGLSENDLQSTGPVRSESDAALAVSEGKADAAFGLEAFAAQMHLPFLPLADERFDLLADRKAWFEPPLQSFLKFCRGEAFQAKAAELAGYDISTFGTVRFNGG